MSGSRLLLRGVGTHMLTVSAFARALKSSVAVNLPDLICVVTSAFGDIENIRFALL